MVSKMITNEDILAYIYHQRTNRIHLVRPLVIDLLS